MVGPRPSLHKQSQPYCVSQKTVPVRISPLASRLFHCFNLTSWPLVPRGRMLEDARPPLAAAIVPSFLLPAEVPFHRRTP